MPNPQWRIRRYVHTDGSEPVSDWLNDLDSQNQRRIRVAIARLQAGNLSAVKWLGGNLAEFRIDTGPGYRIYFTRQGRDELVLLTGGDKSSQASDIKRARNYVDSLKGKV